MSDDASPLAARVLAVMDETMKEKIAGHVMPKTYTEVEVQALIAAKLEEASDAFAKHPSIQMDRYHPQGSWRHSIHDAIRALITPDMAALIAKEEEKN